ncbi:hypothetical protein [Dyella silvae]|uniref:hypothetical protein n=1 Tax=Dyella silvae TaxID=2994424 RepID=UPI002263F3A3|nr:hypothetical protein [Dyella silvae]
MELKTEIWERVRAFALSLASEDQPERYRLNYNALKDYCEAQSAAGDDHPFLWESLADFTLDDDAAIALYLRALSLAAGDEGREYRVSIRFALAHRYKHKGETALARQYAIEADDEARETDDRELRRRISRFLLSRD